MNDNKDEHHWSNFNKNFAVNSMNVMGGSTNEHSNEHIHVLTGKWTNGKAKTEALPGVLGNRGKRVFTSGEQGNKGQILREQGNKYNIGEQGTYENKFSIFGEQENKPIYFRGTREQVPPGRASKLYAHCINRGGGII